MKTATIPKSIQILFLLSLVVFFTACGKSRTDAFGSVDSASVGEGTPASELEASLAKAYCSRDASNHSDLQVHLMQAVDAYNQPIEGFVRLKFIKAPTGWASGNWDMMMYRWTAAPDNSTSLDSQPLQYQFEKRVSSGFQMLSNNSYQYFNWEEIQQMGEYSGINAASPQSFFTTATLLVNLRGSTNSYQVLRVTFRQNGVIMKEADVLIPVYYANPAKYNADARHPLTLQVLHPMKDKVGQNWAEQTYTEFAQGFCF